MKLEADMLQEQMESCMKKQGFSYTADEESAELPGLQFLPPAERKAFVAEKGYGFIAFLRRAKVPSTGQDAEAFTKSQMACEAELPKPTVVLSEVQNKMFQTDLEAAMSTEVWLRSESEWQKCMAKAGYAGLTSSMEGPLKLLSSQAEALSDDKPLNEEDYAELLSRELELAKADDTCRKASLDSIEPVRILELQAELFEADPNILIAAQKILEASGTRKR